jgi:hypothetical protein
MKKIIYLTTALIFFLSCEKESVNDNKIQEIRIIYADTISFSGFGSVSSSININSGYEFEEVKGHKGKPEEWYEIENVDNQIIIHVWDANFSDFNRYATVLIEVDGEKNDSVVIEQLVIENEPEYVLTENDVDFNYSTGELIGFSDSYSGSKNIIIPRQLGGVDVKTIGRDAFWKNTSRLTGVSIPNTVTEIKYGAFLGSYIKELIIPESLTTIGERAFSYNGISELTIPENVINIGHRAFAGNIIEELNFSSSLKSVGTAAFTDNKITTINGVKSNGIIFDKKADGSDDISVINSYGGTSNYIDFIPNTVVRIGSRAFEACGINYLVIPKSVKTIEQSAFRANNLKEIIIPSNIKKIYAYSFANNGLDSFLFENNSSIELIYSNCLYEVEHVQGVDSFILPTNSNLGFSHYKDTEGNVYEAGSVVTNLETIYTIVIN